MSSPTIISLTQLYYYLAFLTRPEYSEHILIQNPFSGCLCLGFSFQNICMIFSITFWGYLLKGYLMTESFSNHPVFPTSLYHALLKKKKKKNLFKKMHLLPLEFTTYCLPLSTIFKAPQKEGLMISSCIPSTWNVVWHVADGQQTLLKWTRWMTGSYAKDFRGSGYVA